MAYAPLFPIAGIQPINDIFTPDATQRWTPGMDIDAVDPYFGAGKFLYLKSGAAYVPGNLVYIVDQTFVTAILPSTANMGRPFLVARQNFSAAGQWGWFQYAGVTPLTASASVAQGVAAGIGTAGNAGAQTAGKQLLGVTVLQPSTFSLAILGQTQNGSNQLGLVGTAGLFDGLAVTGTGIAAASTISSLDPSGRFVTLNNACTATGTATITFTYTGFILAFINEPVTQGAIT